MTHGGLSILFVIILLVIIAALQKLNSERKYPKNAEKDNASKPAYNNNARIYPQLLPNTQSHYLTDYYRRRAAARRMLSERAVETLSQRIGNMGKTLEGLLKTGVNP
jgi:hypothetical protein